MHPVLIRDLLEYAIVTLVIFGWAAIRNVFLEVGSKSDSSRYYSKVCALESELSSTEC